MNTLSIPPFMKLKNFNEQNKERELEKSDSGFGLAKRTYGWTRVYVLCNGQCNELLYCIVLGAVFNLFVS
jgi:hypothetical protein